MKIEKAKVDLTIVIPVLNEEASIGILLEEVYSIWKADELPQATEVIVVNDGSTDGTELEIHRVRRKYVKLPIRLLSHNRTFGQTQALALGFQQSVGEVVVALDGDGQNDPADIAALLAKQRETGVDCVSGWRVQRDGDKGARRVFSKLANVILRKASGTAINDFGCTLKAYRGDVIRQIPLLGDMHRTIPFQIEAMGGTTAEIPVNHRARFAGTSKYSLSRTFSVLQDIIVVFFVKRFILKPMQLLGGLGSLMLAIGVTGILIAVLLKLFGLFDFVETPILLLSLVMCIGGLNIMGTGLIAELLNRRREPSHSLPHRLGWSER